ncbi:MAG: tyrosine-type recombinase/integrase [Solirubrobacterales bacterium]|nr:tyrosine-type recombinase/integrase [Solirubrobacterales bacterium]MBV9717631.1 tyrosine-type recombinase/integrase [Solirubrobacterales bacterium]
MSGGFVVDGPSPAAAEATAFLAWLAARGRGSYTQRAYALGLAHFLGWLDRGGVELDAVDRRVIAEYVVAFRSGAEDGLPLGRQPRTVNHRLCVLATFFGLLERRDREAGGGLWAGRPCPVPTGGSLIDGSHGMPGRDAVRHGRRAEYRQRVPRRLPRRVEPEVAVRLIAAAGSERDRALLTLLWRSGQRVGDWSGVHGQHGILGMCLGDLDRRSGTVVVRLKGARDEHRVPVSDDFWPVFARYLGRERGLGEPEDPAWVMFRRGQGRPLSYAAFECALRALSRRVGVRVTAHMFRHALAQAVVEVAGLKVAQEMLGHAHVSTPADTYARVDEPAMVAAVERARDLFDLQAATSSSADEPGGYVFPYDQATLAELEAAAGEEPGR